jgi:hypothetical protein
LIMVFVPLDYLWRHRMQLLAAIWIPAAVAALVGVVGLYFAKRERQEAELQLELRSRATDVPAETAERPRTLVPHTPKPSAL